MKIIDAEKVKQLPLKKRKKILTTFALLILFNFLLIVGFIAITITMHQSLNTPSSIFALVVGDVSIVLCVIFWLGIWFAFRKIAYSEK